MERAGTVVESGPLVTPARDGRRDSHDWQYALICGAVTLAAIALTWPVAESGVNDDWSYTKTALELAQTGAFHYYGWAAVMLGAQACWGALFIKLFGFSFLTVRLSIAPLAAGCAVLAYGLHRRAGLPPRLALLGALTLALSPVFVPNAASFMTEIPGLFLFLVSVYGYVRAAEVLTESRTAENATVPIGAGISKWLAFALAAGLLAGTVRQTYWLLPVLAPLYLCTREWGCRSSTRSFLPLFLSSIVALAGAIAFSFWFSAQPNMTPSGVVRGFSSAIHLKSVVTCIEFSVRSVLTLGAMALPVAMAIPWLLPKWLETERKPWLFVLQALLLTLILYRLVFSALGSWHFPWLGNMFDRVPYLTGTAPHPAEAIPLIFSWRFWGGFSKCVIALVCGIAAMMSLTGFRRRHKAGAPFVSIQSVAVSLARVPVPLALLAIFAATYIPVLLLKSLVPDPLGFFDRHLLPLLPGVTLALLIMYYRSSKRDRVPYPAWLVLILFGFYGIAQTHDYFAQLRTRLALTAQLEGRGIPRTRIMAGLEYDGWTQITVAGSVRTHPPPAPLPFETAYTLWPATPVVRPDYVVSFGRHPDLFDTDLPAAPFHCWLPPFRRKLVVQTPERGLIRVRSLPLSLDRTAPATSPADGCSKVAYEPCVSFTNRNSAAQQEFQSCVRH